MRIDGWCDEHFDERQVGIFVGAFKYVVEISDRLVRMNQKNQLEFPHRGPRDRFTG